MQVEGFGPLERLGSGGLGDVYVAVRLSTGSRVAIKVLRDWSDSSVSWHRARRELRALVGLQGHPNVVHIEEVIEVDGVPLLVMEFCAGGAIDAVVKRDGKLPFNDVVLVGKQTSAALSASHQLGIIHLDIKPQNLLIGTFGQVKVCDFGIAALTQDEQFKTRTNAASFKYSSPEQLNDEPDVGSASDIYSLGTTLAHLASGSPLPVVVSVTTNERRPFALARSGEWDSTAQDRFENVVNLCLRVDPDSRPTATELVEEFSTIANLLGDRRSRTLNVSAGPFTAGLNATPRVVTAQPNHGTQPQSSPADPSTANPSTADQRSQSPTPDPAELPAPEQPESEAAGTISGRLKPRVGPTPSITQNPVENPAPNAPNVGIGQPGTARSTTGELASPLVSSTHGVMGPAAGSGAAAANAMGHGWTDPSRFSPNPAPRQTADRSRLMLYVALVAIGATIAVMTFVALRRASENAYPDPFVTDPFVTDPFVTDPFVTDPVVTDPLITDPFVAPTLVPGATLWFAPDGSTSLEVASDWPELPNPAALGSFVVGQSANGYQPNVSAASEQIGDMDMAEFLDATMSARDQFGTLFVVSRGTKVGPNGTEIGWLEFQGHLDSVPSTDVHMLQFCSIAGHHVSCAVLTTSQDQYAELSEIVRPYLETIQAY